MTLHIFSPVVSHDRNIPGSQLSGVLLPGSGRARVNCELSWTLLQLEPEFLPPPQCYTSSGHQPRPLSQTTSDDNNVTDHRSLDHLGASCWAMFSDCLQVVVIENNGSGDDPDDVRHGHQVTSGPMPWECWQSRPLSRGHCPWQLIVMVRQTSWHWLHCSVSMLRTIGQKTVSNALTNCHCSCQPTLAEEKQCLY